VLQLLGWKIKYQTYLQGREPDYALFADNEAFDAALTAGHMNPNFWQHATLVADAKAWHVSLDRPIREGSRREYPPEQIEWYLDRSRLDFGILTNGRLWRLVPREIGARKPRFKTYLEVDLPHLLERLRENLLIGEELNDLTRFFLFFSPTGYSTKDVAQSLVSRAVQGSAEYSISIGEDLKERVFEALRICIQGFLSVAENELDAAAQLNLYKEQSLILLYRLLFIMFAEDRRLLPYRINRTYTHNRSLGRHRDQIAARIDGSPLEGFTNDSYALWNDLSDLFDLIDRGHGTYGVPAYNGGLFDTEQHEFLATKKISDWYLAKVIDQLGRAPDPAHPRAGLFRVDYRDLAVQQLGGVYEGLLELVPRYAATAMIVVRERSGDRRSERIQPLSDPIPAGFEAAGNYDQDSVYLETDKGERRSYGSYYTPDHIVAHITHNTLEPLCSAISLGLSNEINAADQDSRSPDAEIQNRAQEALTGLRRDFANRVLKLRIVDPAMGSGHFLVRACQYLAEEIATNPYTDDEDANQQLNDESTLTYWKRRVVEACIFGVDLNPLAVELAKLSLWLDTVSVGHPLSFLDHHLVVGNSLVGARLRDLGALPDAPPIVENQFGAAYQSRVPGLVSTLANIQRLPSDTTRQVKEKARLLRTQFRPLADAFRLVADLWCSFFFHHRTSRPSPAVYDAVVQQLQRRPATQEISDVLATEGLLDAVEVLRDGELKCFHWEIQFPDIFESETLDRGFDAIIGNPPYDVLSEKELQRSLSEFKRYIRWNTIYDASRKGKNNLYKLFLCKMLDILRDDGRMGVIVPMALLGDDSACLVRRLFVQHGAFARIDAFPQKDDARRRVFTDAKLSTCVVHYLKTQDAERQRSSFRSQVHPEDKIDPVSPGLSLSTAAIPLYDPINFTIVSCSQRDWDIATRIMETGRLERLRNRVEFFQGEVNETNERAAGNLRTSGKKVVRGANVCLYVLRTASQGTDIFLDVPGFLDEADEEAKAYHHQYARVAVQESSPQNNFRRIIASLIPANEFCNHTINYAPEHKSSLPLSFVAALLNSDLSDWYFRLGSTNAHVSHYQLYNLPCPVFADEQEGRSQSLIEEANGLIAEERIDDLKNLLSGLSHDPPFEFAIVHIIAAIVRRIVVNERARGDISRSARSALAPEAQVWQDIINTAFYEMAGLDDQEQRDLRASLSTML
jgi:hypothetical protein